MKTTEMIEPIFAYVLERYLLKVVIERCRLEYTRRPRNHVVVSSAPASRLKCPSCRKHVMAARYTHHLSKCMDGLLRG